VQAFPAWLRSGRVIIGLMIIVLVGLCAVFAPYLAPHDPSEQNLIATLLPPAWADGGDPAFPLGTDSLGRDILSRLIFGARVALTVAFFASVGAMSLGAILAHAAGYFGG
jgi:peptide/nickel transport system permease protein